jgi:hypothetical protein
MMIYTSERKIRILKYINYQRVVGLNLAYQQKLYLLAATYSLHVSYCKVYTRLLMIKNKNCKLRSYILEYNISTNENIT